MINAFCRIATLAIVALVLPVTVAMAGDTDKGFSSDAPLLEQLNDASGALADLIARIKDLEAEDRFQTAAVRDSMAALRDMTQAIGATVRSGGEQARSLCNNEVIDGLLLGINQRMSMGLSAPEDVNAADFISRIETLHRSFGTAVRAAQSGC